MKRIGAAKSISARAGLVDRASILEQQPKPAAEALNRTVRSDYPSSSVSVWERNGKRNQQRMDGMTGNIAVLRGLSMFRFP